ncbi:MAG TPA: protein-glutamate O-methyltransferase CheR [Candidatus Methanoperedenaceae archaeon]|nr:protein-glutamate O-methyltransferase CheR [Candidatus Methanoperedenaceae archaeon]
MTAVNVLQRSVPVHEDDRDFADLKAIIKKKIGFNCNEYKQAHLKRRLAVRLRASNTTSYKDYASILLKNSEEPGYLKQVLTVNVTELFRNPETYESFGRNVLPNLIRSKESDRRIRIWSAGCSNGEEVHSIAILLLEALGSRARRFDISILGSDIDDESLEIAAKGLYKPKNIEKIRKERLSRFFTRMDDYYTVTDDIRDIIRFKHHDMISGVCLGGFDVIFCRNVTIYFDQKLQERLYMNFYNSLNDGGYFVMGKTETLVGPAGRMFRPVDLKERIYQKVKQ